MGALTRPATLAGKSIRVPLQKAFRTFCRSVVRTFYRKCEVYGASQLPKEGPLVLCANHPSALVDAVILQAVISRPLHPMARSGLFRNPLLRPLLAIIQAVPVYRRQDPGVDPSRNTDAFRACHALLDRGEALLIFPEGESHADAGLRTLRTGAARIVLEFQRRNGHAPRLVPVGLTFTDLGRFRSSVLVNIGQPLPIIPSPEEAEEEASRRLTEDLRLALRDITLDLSSWEDLELLRRMERFFALRGGRYRKGSLSQRFRAWKKLSRTVAVLRRTEPERLERVRWRLERFERQCAKWGVRDYHLTLRYTPSQVIQFIVRSLLGLSVLMPLAVYGWLNAIVPYKLTTGLAPKLTRGRYQLETAQISLGMGFFALFWGSQTAFMWQTFDGPAAALYVLSLPLGSAAALFFARERERIVDNLRVFFRFTGRAGLRETLAARRKELEYELARLTQA
ncbi:MAG: lysophospholipid acyltransferase family protein, partial [Deltaproteobacteria bacterium]|nr:lysophospholipid acyltransferase family protein [Deltaproteobacteria bacterium]